METCEGSPGHGVCTKACDLSSSWGHSLNSGLDPLNGNGTGMGCSPWLSGRCDIDADRPCPSVCSRRRQAWRTGYTVAGRVLNIEGSPARHEEVVEQEFGRGCKWVLAALVQGNMWW